MEDMEYADASGSTANARPIDPALLGRFGRSMRENFASGSIPFRKARLQSLIEVDDTADE